MHSVCAPFAGISLSVKCVFTFTVPFAIYHLTAGPRAAQHTHFGLFVLSRRRTTTHWPLSSKHVFRNGSFNFMCMTWAGGGGWFFLECGSMTRETGWAQCRRWEQYCPTGGHRQMRDGTWLWKPLPCMSVAWQWASGAQWDEAQRDELHVPNTHKTAGAIPTALWSWTEVMRLCGAEMVSTAPSATEIIAKRNKAREIAWFEVFFQSCGVVFCSFVLSPWERREEKPDLCP